MKLEPNDPAFPLIEMCPNTGHACGQQKGPTVRAEFASRFMAGMLSREKVSIYGANDLAHHAVRLADALIIQLNEPQEP